MLSILAYFITGIVFSIIATAIEKERFLYVISKIELFYIWLAIIFLWPIIILICIYIIIRPVFKYFKLQKLVNWVHSPLLKEKE